MTTHVSVEVAPSTVTLSNLSMLDPVLKSRLVRRIVKDESMSEELAERVLDQSIGYLKLAAKEPGQHYSPSPLVDIGWHTFILYTREYGKFCRELTGGKFIHHEPTDNPSVPNNSKGPYRTMQAMKSAGIVVDEPLWACLCKSDYSQLNGGDCRNCNAGQGCQCGSCNY